MRVSLSGEMFNIYLKMKYPALYEQVESNEAFLYSEFKKIEKLRHRK